jgi:Flp pilus assembly protein TadD
LQHIGYWKLLLASGRANRAAELAQAYPGAPRSPGELIELARVFSQVGIRNRATELFVRYVPEFAASPNFWVGYANELIETRNWPELQGLGVQIRSHQAVADALRGFSYFVEGRAEMALQRPQLADVAFSKMVERGFEHAQLGLNAATELLALHRPAFARDILAKLQTELAADVKYWTTLFAAADELKDCDLMLHASRQAYALLPTNPSVMNNYAAALLILRQNPDEVARLTLQLLAAKPGSIVTKINHSAALLLNERPGEAEAILKTVRTNTLNRAQMTILNLNLFEAQYRLGRLDQAQAMTGQIEEEFLYPPQRAWLGTMRKQLPAPKAREERPEGKG